MINMQNMFKYYKFWVCQSMNDCWKQPVFLLRTFFFRFVLFTLIDVTSNFFHNITDNAFPPKVRNSDKKMKFSFPFSAVESSRKRARRYTRDIWRKMIVTPLT